MRDYLENIVDSLSEVSESMKSESIFFYHLSLRKMLNWFKV